MIERPLLTTVVGSYAQPDWLVHRDLLGSRLPPRVRAREIWRPSDQLLEEAWDDATVVAIREMEVAGVELISDGEMRRESYSNRFATALGGVDIEKPGIALDRTGHPNPVPRIVAPIVRGDAVMAQDVLFAKRYATRPVKITCPGPFTMTQQAQDDYYGDEREVALAFAAAVNAELADLKKAGADVVQIDEPYLQARPEKARAYALDAIDAALHGIEGQVVLHTCFGYAHIVHDRPNGYPFLEEMADCAATHLSIESAQQNVDLRPLESLQGKTIVLGVIDLSDESPIETPEMVAARVRNALQYVSPERLWLSPDCGMKYLPRVTAFQKLRAMARGAAIVRAELGL